MDGLNYRDLCLELLGLKGAVGPQIRLKLGVIPQQICVLYIVQTTLRRVVVRNIVGVQDFLCRPP